MVAVCLNGYFTVPAHSLDSVLSTFQASRVRTADSCKQAPVSCKIDLREKAINRTRLSGDRRPDSWCMTRSNQSRESSVSALCRSQICGPYRKQPDSREHQGLLCFPEPHQLPILNGSDAIRNTASMRVVGKVGTCQDG